MSQPPGNQRILIIRPSALGDVCRSVTVLASLRAAYPQAVIDWVVQDDFAAVIEAHPALNTIIRFPRSSFAGWWKSPAALIRAMKWLNELRQHEYDLVLDCQGLSRSGLMTIASGAPRRVGLRPAREFAWLSYTLRVPQRRADSLPAHTVDQMLMLVEAIGVRPIRDVRLYVSQDHRQWWADRLSQWQVEAGSYAVLAPTSRWVSKRWPMERFAQLVCPLLDRGFSRVMVIGSPSETEQVQPLFEQAKKSVKPEYMIDMVGKTSIGQTMAMIAGAGLVIANDSAPLHMAVGFDRVCLGLFGPTDPEIVGPYQRTNAVIRGYAPQPGERINYKSTRLGDRLMRLISTAAVLQKVDQVMMSRPLTNTAVPWQRHPAPAAETAS